MRRVIGLTLTIVVGITLMTPRLVFAADLTGKNRLEEVTLFHEGEGSRLVIRMREGVTQKPNLRFFEKSLQVDLPQAYAVPAKKEMPLDASNLTMAGIYQRSPELLRLRFFTKGDGRTLQGVTNLVTDGNLIILTVATPAPVAQETPVATPVAAPVAVEESAPQVAEPLAEETPVETKPVVAKDPLRSAPIARPLTPRTDWSDAKGSATGAAESNKEAGPLAGLFVRKVEAAQTDKAADATTSKTGYLKYEKATPPQAPDLGAASIKMVVALAVTIGLFLLVAVLFRKFQGKMNLGATGADALVRTLASAPLGPKQRIALVEVAGEVMALGVSEDSISLLTTIDDAETADRIRRMGGGTTPGAGDAALLASVTEALGKGKGKKKAPKQGMLARLGLGGKTTKKSPLTPPPALMDEADLDTFAGKLAQAAAKEEETYTRNAKPTPRPVPSQPSREGVEPRPSREELLRRVTGAIRGANASLQSA